MNVSTRSVHGQLSDTHLCT